MKRNTKRITHASTRLNELESAFARYLKNNPGVKQCHPVKEGLKMFLAKHSPKTVEA